MSVPGEKLGRLQGKVAFVTGVARGIGRAIGTRFAEEGADIVGLDIPADVDTMGYQLGTEDDLEQTVELVQSHGRGTVIRAADVRDFAHVKAVVEEGLSRFGHIDIAVANAAVSGSKSMSWEIEESAWENTIAVNVTGVWHTTKAVIPSMIERGRGGSIVIISSALGLRPAARKGDYVTSKHAVVGLMRNLAFELAPYMIRANTIHPGNVETPMFSENAGRVLLPDVESPTREQLAKAASLLTLMPVPWLEPVDIANGALWLASDEARYVTGVTLSIDAGQALQWSHGAKSER